MTPLWQHATTIFLQLSAKLAENYSPSIRFLEILEQIMNEKHVPSSKLFEINMFFRKYPSRQFKRI